MHLFFWLACTTQKVQLETFETTWTVINESFPYEDFNGADWNAVHEEYLPKAKKAKTPEELRPILNGMLSELNVSHLGIIPQEEYVLLNEQLDEASDEDQEAEASSKDGSAEDSTSSKTEDVNSPEQGWAGIKARWIDDQLVVTHVDLDSNIVSESVQTGWVIQAINGTSIEEVASRYDDAREQQFSVGILAERSVFGDVGEHVVLELLDGNGQVVEQTLPFQKGDVITSGGFANLPATGVTFVHEHLEGNIDRIAFSSFLMPIRSPMVTAFEEMSEAPPTGLIIDLRGNLGGLIALGQFISSYLISEPDLDLGEQISRDSNLFLTIHPRPSTLIYTGPVAILVDELSASTSEVVAGGLQELGRVTVFGQQTAGKALPSGIRELPNGDRLQYVLFDLKKISGGRYEGDGVIPDYAVQREQKEYVNGIDPELAAAVEWIEGLNTNIKIEDVETK
jgi:carboxyl-terminal processing protease